MAAEAESFKHAAIARVVRVEPHHLEAITVSGFQPIDDGLHVRARYSPVCEHEQE